MAKKTYNEKIAPTTDWGGDESTGGLPVAGNRVQEFIKEQLNSKSNNKDMTEKLSVINKNITKSKNDISNLGKMLTTKAGVFYFDNVSGRYLVFADEESQEKYLSDPKQSDLLLGVINANSGSSENYSAVINLESPMYNAISLGTAGNYIDFTFAVYNKSDMPTGEPVICTYTIRKASIKQTVVEQYSAGRSIHFNIDKYLSEGTNQITVTIQGMISMATVAVGITYQVMELQLTCDYDIAQVFNLSNGAKTLSAEFFVKGYGVKILEWYIDGLKLDFEGLTDEVVNESVKRTKYIQLSDLSEGVHSLQVRASTTVEGEVFYSDTIYKEFMVHNGIASTPMAAIAMTVPSMYGIITTKRLYSMQQYVSYTLDFATYNPKSYNVDVVIKLGGVRQGSLVSENGVANQITLFTYASGDNSIELVMGETVYTLAAEITSSTISVGEIADGLQLDFRALGKSNNATDKDSWNYGEFSGLFSGFNWNNTSGWVDNALHINAGASFGIDLAPFSKNPSVLGKTIEVEFASTNVNDDNAILCDLRDTDGTGLLITATNVKLTSQAGVTIETSYKDNEFIRVAFVINKASGTTNKCMSFIYVNGIVSRGTVWVSNDLYTSDALLKFVGSQGAEIKLKALRIYDTALTNDQVLNNYILYRDTIAQMIEVYDRNDIYAEDSNEFDYEKMMSRLPVMIVTGDIPALENTSDKNLQIAVDVEYYNLQDQSLSFSMQNAAMRPQGTSSMGYPKKNFRLYTQKRDDTVVLDANGYVVEDKLYAFKKGSQPVNCWCMKADYAESSGTHNTGIARLWNKVLIDAMIGEEYLFRTEAQKTAFEVGYNYDVRTTVDGFPILMFYRLTKNDPLVFIGKYNFNNDKSTESVFGFTGIPNFDNSRMQCWELLNNGNSLALFKTVENFDNAWSDAFESRYPDTKTPDTTYLKAFCTWMANVSASDFVTQKWKHLDVYKVAAYYIYLMRFGAVDQTVKNAMFTSEDGVHFYFINYDNDTINGLINTGHLVAPWNTVRTTLGADGEPYFAGKDSRIWNMLEEDAEFMSIVKQVDEALYVAGLRYENVIQMFDEEQAGKWVERVYNQDAQYKYINPYIEKGVNNLFMLQGNRSQHRKLWLAKRFSYFDSIFVSGAYKAHAIEIKCIDNTPAGQKITITSGTAMDYGYGINNVAHASNITLEEDAAHTFTTDETVNRGDPIRIYAAPHIKGLDLSAMADRLAVVTIDNVYDASMGTKLKKLIIGNSVKENVAVEDISGLHLAESLEYLDVRNMKGLMALNLSNQKNINHVDATGSNIANIEFAKGAALQVFKMPTAMRVMKLEQLPYLTNVASENNFMTLRKINVRSCPYLTQDFNFVYNWRMNTQLDTKNLELDMTGVYWINVAPESLISLGDLGSINLKGKVYVTSATQEQIDAISDIFGVDCFENGSEFQVIVPDGLFIGGLNEVRGGESIELNAVIFSDNPSSVIWSIASGSGASVKSTGETTCVVTTTESTSDQDVVVQARHVPSGAGEVTYATKTIKVLKVVRAASGSISGPATVGGVGEYSYIASPSGINAPYSVTWSLTGDAMTAGYVQIKSQNNETCQVQVLQKVNDTSFNIVATVNNGKTTFNVSRTVTIGVKMILNIFSNQPNDDTFSAVKATVEYGSSSTTMGNGDELNLASNTEIKVTFPNVSGYKTPSPIEFVIGEDDAVKSGTYLAESVEVNLSSYDGGSLAGSVVRINNTDYTWQGNTIKVKIPYDTSYTISYNRVGSYLPPSKQTFTASQVARSISAVYDEIPEGLVIIDQTITDPAAMISGSVNSSVIQQIRANSHRYLGKYTADGQMTLCQLSDDDSTKYKDGSAAILTGAEGDVFLKLPDFWYRSLEIDTDIWGIQFQYGSTSPGSGWNKWDKNTLIGVYEAYSVNSKIYSRSGVGSSGGISQSYFKTYARSRGTGFQIVDWQMHCVMALLYYAQYGHTNCQGKIGAGTYSYSKICGQTNALGMEDTVAGGNGDSLSINFWGLENWWGNKNEWIDNVVVQDFVFNVTEPDGKVRVAGKMVGAGWITKMLFGEHCDLIPIYCNSSDTSGFCDSSNRKSGTCVVFRSGSTSYSGSGVAHVRCDRDSLYINLEYGSRLAFRGVCVEAESVAAFKAMKAIG